MNKSQIIFTVIIACIVDCQRGASLLTSRAPLPGGPLSSFVLILRIPDQQKAQTRHWHSDKHQLEKGLRSQTVWGNTFTCKSASLQRSTKIPGSPGLFCLLLQQKCFSVPVVGNNLTVILATQAFFLKMIAASGSPGCSSALERETLSPSLWEHITFFQKSDVTRVSSLGSSDRSSWGLIQV